MKEKYIKIKDLSVSEKLANFINDKLLPGTKISKERFWNGFNKYIHELSPKNKNLIEKREKIQKLSYTNKVCTIIIGNLMEKA